LSDHDGSYGSGRFCSRACANSRTTTQESNQKRRSKLTKVKVCRKCSEKFRPAESGHRQLCTTCKEARLPQYPDRSWDQLNTDGYRRKRLLELRGHRCESCGIETWIGEPIPLDLDHVDGNSDNNSIENCRLLCANCHRLQPTTGRKNPWNHNTTRKRHFIEYCKRVAEKNHAE
jgi:hypothetical protein